MLNLYSIDWSPVTNWISLGIMKVFLILIVLLANQRPRIQKSDPGFKLIWQLELNIMPSHDAVKRWLSAVVGGACRWHCRSLWGSGWEGGWGVELHVRNRPATVWLMTLLFSSVTSVAPGDSSPPKYDPSPPTSLTHSMMNEMHRKLSIFITLNDFTLTVIWLRSAPPTGQR